MDNFERAFWVAAGWRAAQGGEDRSKSKYIFAGAERKAWLEGYDGYMAHAHIEEHSKLEEEKKTMEADQESNWGIVELMGRKVVAGLITKSEMIGPPMLRVDVPATKNFGAFTQFYGATSLYAVTFTSEEVARKTAESVSVNPVSVYVPELVSKERFDQLEQKAMDLRDKLQQAMRMLPAGTKIELPESPNQVEMPGISDFMQDSDFRSDDEESEE